MKKLISLLSIISILLLVGCSESKNTNQTVKETISQKLTVATEVRRNQINFVKDKDESIDSVSVSHNLAKKIYDVLCTQSGYDDMSGRFTVKQFNEYYGVTDFRVTTDNMCYCKFVDNSTKEKYYVFFGLSKENAQWCSVFILDKNNKQTKKTNKADINNQNLIQLINKNDL